MTLNQVAFLEPSNSSVEEDILEEEGKDAEVIFGEKSHTKTKHWPISKWTLMALLQQCCRPETKGKLQ